jgi:hypothetical protein
LLHLPEHGKNLVSDAFEGFDLKGQGFRQSLEPFAINDGGCITPAKHFRANRQMQFIHQTGAEQGIVQAAAAFAEEALDTPFPAQPAKGLAEIDFLPAANLYFVRHSPQLTQLRLRCTSGGENDDGRKTVLKNLRAGIE